MFADSTESDMLITFVMLLYIWDNANVLICQVKEDIVDLFIINDTRLLMDVYLNIS